MEITFSPFLLVLILVVVLILVPFLLWLYGEFLKKKYFDHAVDYMLQPERAPQPVTTWTPVSAPDANGVYTSTATAPLDDTNEQIGLEIRCNDLMEYEEFTRNVKVRFSPIYEPPPPDPFDSLLKTLSLKRGLKGDMAKQLAVTERVVGKIPVEEDSSEEEVGPELLLQFGVLNQTRGQYGAAAEERKEYYAVAFNIDPTIRREHAINQCPRPRRCKCNVRHTYSSTEANIRVTVAVSVGAVGAATSNVSAGGTATITIANPTQTTKRMVISGKRAGDNTYRLSGTWNKA